MRKDEENKERRLNDAAFSKKSFNYQFLPRAALKPLLLTPAHCPHGHKQQTAKVGAKRHLGRRQVNRVRTILSSQTCS